MHNSAYRSSEVDSLRMIKNGASRMSTVLKMHYRYHVKKVLAALLQLSVSEGITEGSRCCLARSIQHTAQPIGDQY
jgi:hypothetical protein